MTLFTKTSDQTRCACVCVCLCLVFCIVSRSRSACLSYFILSVEPSVSVPGCLPSLSTKPRRAVVSAVFLGQAAGFDGHARGILTELEGVFQVFEDVTEIRCDSDDYCSVAISVVWAILRGTAQALRCSPELSGPPRHPFFSLLSDLRLVVQYGGLGCGTVV